MSDEIPFETVIDQEGSRAWLARAIRSGRLGHALLIVGPEGVGKRALSVALAEAVACPEAELACGRCRICHRIAALGHPDLWVLWPESARAAEDERAAFQATLAADPYRALPSDPSLTIAVERVRTMRAALARSPYEASRRVVLIWGAERLRPEAASTLLKTLEEPPEDVLIVLTATTRAAVLPTIRSRCQVLRLSSVGIEGLTTVLQRRTDLEPEVAGLCARLADGSVSRALTLAETDIEAARTGSLELIRTGLTGTTAEVLEEAKTWVASGSDGAEDCLRWGLIWLRDALLAASGCEGNLVNADRTADAQALAEALGLEGLMRGVTAAERALGMLARNLSAETVLAGWLLALTGREEAHAVPSALEALTAPLMEAQT
jgi:DNA polymerase-3 subunit delta'